MVLTSLLACCGSAAMAQGFGYPWMHRTPYHPHAGGVFCNYHAPIVGAYGFGGVYAPWGVSTPWSNMTFGTYAYRFYGFGSPYSMGHLHSQIWQPQVSFPSPVIVYTQPTLPFVNSALLQETIRENQRRWNAPLDLQPVQVRFRQPKRSTLQGRAKSLRYQRLGDVRFRNGDYVLAYAEYRKAVAAAEDQSRAQFRLALSLTALNRFTIAVKHFRRAVEIDPTLPTSGDSLSLVYGPSAQIAKAVDLRKAADWVREDIRDPDRLFLLGVMLHFDDSTDKAAACFEAALRLAGHGEHLKAFLRPQPVVAARNVGARVAPNAAVPPAGVAPQIPPAGGVPQVPPLPPLPIP